MAEAETVTYRGNCHCGSFVFETKVPEIKSALDCNCSICSKKGYLWIFPGEGNVKIVKGSVEELTAYEFGPKKLKHLFCPTCATAVAGARETEQGGLQLAVNAHTFQGLNTWDLEKSSYDGAPLGDPYQAPVHKGELPAAESEGVVYTGSCHCGAVTIATVSKPLDETYEGPIECNCSSCERIAALWVYCPSKSVVLSGDEANIGRYRFNERMLHKGFCKICGVILTNSFDELSEDRIAALPEKMRNIRDRQHMFTGVNARVLNGVDVTKFKTTRKVEGLTKLPGDYVNP